MLDWVQSQSDWVDTQLGGLPQAEPFRPGATIPYSGRRVLLAWNPDMGRMPSLVDDCLSCGGPLENFPKRIERHLRDEARRKLSEETEQVAARAGVSVKSVSVGDTSSRWGSCSANGAIRYNWRLILAPPHLLRWVVAHEVAHRRHMDHGPRFKALEVELYDGNVTAARAELRALGPGLKRVGRLF
jgi:predicted metal-dependent hydrolase